jgi:hypothetical protein
MQLTVDSYLLSTSNQIMAIARLDDVHSIPAIDNCLALQFRSIITRH